MRKILVISPSWVGDCMLMQPMLMRLRQRHPDCRIDVLAPPWTVALLRAIPEVHDIIVNPFPHGVLQLGARYQLAKRLRATNYNQAIMLPNSWKSALVPFFAHIPKRTGFVGESRYILLNDVRKLDKSKLPLDKPVAAFCPGAEYGPAKRWPTAYYADVAQRLRQQGYAIWLIGSGKDKPVADEINQLAGNTCSNLCGSTDLGDAIALLSCANLVISNDSGLMHLAAALDRPMLALFGSSSPQFTPPLSARAQVVKLDIECSPCFKRDCPLGHFKCMTQLTPGMVWDRLTRLLQEQSKP